ncbi:phage tail tape measure protein [Leucobacter rhizosphaerae]|uniref:Phage tail tape measure protein n=1 Tax=Leucobacter rhizosphaerae TaxID=2932245 RepID=A0ABY4FW79_9MICO|nr:phage tail tape measure protein [Leucobacter rhizosphaerae]UOQ60389.1 phage tail tape measure protein [Leucobacter rhizosphaerae]
MADRSTKVIITAQAQQYIAEMEKAARATKETGSEAEKLAQKTQAFEMMGRTAMVAGGAMAAGLGLSAKAAIDWDSAWAGVTKTVDGSPEQLAAVEAGLRGLSGVLPASHDEIAAVAEAAGQLGIKTPEVVAFTKTMIDLGETTNLSSDAAATSLARFMNVMGTSQSEVSSLGSALVELGNNYATTEAEIMEMAQRLSGAGVQIGMSEGQVLGLSTALSSVGIEAEAGGSAMSKVMIDIASSVDKGGDRMKQFADVAGLSADDFAAKWRKDPGEALAAFVTGLANAEAQGKSTFGVLEELGITEVRMRDALLRSASAADQFSEAMNVGNQAMEENTALTEEAEKRYETTAAKLEIMRNQVVDAAISIGEAFLPAIEGVAEGVGDFASGLSGMEGPATAVIAWVGAIASGIVLTGGVALAAVPKIAAYKVALETLNIAGTRAARGIGMVARAAVGIGVFAAASAGVDALANTLADKMSPSAEETTNKITTAKSAVEAFAGAAEARFPGTAKGADIAKDSISGLAAALDEAASSNFWNPIDPAIDSSVLADWRIVGEEISKVASSDLPAAQAQFRQVADAAGLTSEQMAQLINVSQPLKDVLTEQATALGLAADESTLVELALGKIGPAADQAAEGTQSAAEAYVEAADQAKVLSDQLMQLLDSYNELNGIGQSAEQQNAALQSSFAGLQEYVENAQAGTEGYALSLDETTAAGASNRAMLADHAATVLQNAQAQFELESATLGSAEASANYEARLASGRQQIYDTAFALTGNAEAAQALTDKILQMPTAKEIEVLLRGAQEVEDQLNQVARRRETEIGVRYIGGGGTMTAANGNLVAYANGGVEAYASGGFPTGIYSGGAPIHKFAEPETGWEAYISGKPSERDRNRQIWVDAGQRLGVGFGGSSAPPVVYVQNPFTGEYLLGKVDQRANAAIDTSLEQQARERRKAGQ